MSRQIGLPLAALALFGAPLAAQTRAAPDSAPPAPLCWTARPAPRCTALLVTNLGGYVDLGAGGGARLAEDAGVMVNVARRDAVGATYYLTMDETGLFSSGPAVRYRRWLSDSRTLDLAIGILGPAKNADRGALMGLIRYGVGPYLGFVLRPEVVRGCAWDQCQFAGAAAVTRFRVSVGVEIGSWPGAVIPAVAGLVGALAFLVSPPHIL